MISRIWHGWTTPENADKYEALLREEIFVGIQSRGIPGFRQIQLLRRPLETEVEFVTIMEFDSLPSKARAVLAHFDARSRHYEIKIARRRIRRQSRQWSLNTMSGSAEH